MAYRNGRNCEDRTQMTASWRTLLRRSEIAAMSQCRSTLHWESVGGSSHVIIFTLLALEFNCTALCQSGQTFPFLLHSCSGTDTAFSSNKKGEEEKEIDPKHLNSQLSSITCPVYIPMDKSSKLAKLKLSMIIATLPRPLF